MYGSLLLWVGAPMRMFRSRRSLLIENLALPQQLAVLKRQNSRPRLAALDKLFWVVLRRFWSSWKAALIVVSPDTVVRGGIVPASNIIGDFSRVRGSRSVEDL